jgi:hypothetical protein
VITFDELWNYQNFRILQNNAFSWRNLRWINNNSENLRWINNNSKCLQLEKFEINDNSRINLGFFFFSWWSRSAPNTYSWRKMSVSFLSWWYRSKLRNIFCTNLIPLQLIAYKLGIDLRTFLWNKICCWRLFVVNPFYYIAIESNFCTVSNSLNSLWIGVFRSLFKSVIIFHESYAAMLLYDF